MGSNDPLIKGQTFIKPTNPNAEETAVVFKDKGDDGSEKSIARKGLDKVVDYFSGPDYKVLRGNEAGQYNTKRALEIQAMRLAHDEAEKQKKADQEKNYILDQQRKKARNEVSAGVYKSSSEANETIKDLDNPAFNAKTVEELRDIVKNDPNNTTAAQLLSSVDSEYGKKPDGSVPLRPTTTTQNTYTQGRAAQQPSAGGQGNGGVVAPPPKNKPNQYTFADGHKEFDPSKIPEVLQGGKITPARYFAQNGMNWFKDSKRIAAELGMTNYRGTPGENYALIQAMEDKKNGKAPGAEGGEGSNRKFDGVTIGDNIPNRFTEEDRQQLMTMSPDEQKKYISQRNLDDLKAMLPGNVGLINKVFGTNYTADDLSGGIGRSTIMGTGMTAKGMEVQRLIDGLKIGQAQKWMQKNGELDNSQANNAIIDRSTVNPGTGKTEFSNVSSSNVQSGRRQILQDIVDGKRTADGTSLDENDQTYMADYKQYKAEKLVADQYNKLTNEWNNMDPKADPMGRNLKLKEIQQLVNNTMTTNPDVYKSLKPELDRIPEFVKNGKIPNITGKENPDTTKTPPAGGSEGSITKPPITTKTYNNVAPNSGIVTPENPKTSTAGGGSVVPGKETNSETNEMPVQNNTNISTSQKYSGGGYSKNEYEPRNGYSSNSISKG